MTTYRDSGVDIDVGQSAVNMIQKVIQKQVWKWNLWLQLV